MGVEESSLLSLPEVARRLEISLDEALTLVQRKALVAGRGADGGVYVAEGDVIAHLAARTSA